MRLITTTILILFCLSLYSQKIYLYNKQIDVRDLTGNPTLDSVGVIAGDVLYDITFYVKNEFYNDDLDSNFVVLDTFLIPSVRKSLLAQQLFYSIANAQSEVAQAEARIATEADLTSGLAKLNAGLVALNGKNYLATCQDNVGAFEGYWRIDYWQNASTVITKYFRIKSDGTIVEVQNGANNTVVPKPNGYTGTVQMYHPTDRMQLKNLFPGGDIMLARKEGERMVFVRAANKIVFQYMSDQYQQKQFIE